ncbi:hypothetical protein ECANGB1_2651 [Enterospora canceri]|uniref:Uncharacterized protein n=1 Tax=Enterospora canceri TaxID=1081671 RepID=A0A1Y1S707_9MICR|nr:hypothetical protein ECANGB1_2651 [Enterospora canceri]
MASYHLNCVICIHLIHLFTQSQLGMSSCNSDHRLKQPWSDVDQKMLLVLSAPELGVRL